MRTPFAIVILALLLGCKHQDVHSFAYVNVECDRLYKVYLDSEQREARRSLQRAIGILESAKIQTHIKARGLSWGYSRLFVLEKRAGNRAQAADAMAQAHYWFIQLAEAEGASQVDAAAHADQVATEDSLVARVDTWDKGGTHGRGARYAEKQ